MLVNYAVALFALANLFDDRAFALQLSSVLGIASGMIFNFLGSRFFVFRKRYVRK